MAKKLLAILLAVAMVFSLGVTAFAADGEVAEPVLIPEPEQLEDTIYISAKSEWVKPGKTVSVPVSIISKMAIAPDEAPDVYFFAFKFELADTTYATIKEFNFNENFEGYDKFEYVINSLADDGSLTIAFVVKAADTVDLFNQERLEIGTIEVAVSEDFPGGDSEIVVIPSAIRIDTVHKNAADGFNDVYFKASTKAKGISYWDANKTLHNFTTGDTLCCLEAHCVQKMPWQDKIVLILKDWGHSILGFFSTILTILNGLF